MNRCYPIFQVSLNKLSNLKDFLICRIINRPQTNYHRKVSNSHNRKYNQQLLFSKINKISWYKEVLQRHKLSSLHQSNQKYNQHNPPKNSK